ncbi:hypothetical protein SAMN05421823_10359 [Catalinimonas alkaloidigena]|uniref:Uncharacterized protein n=1 Tax=Catalinimonas alkaloidigena TaxID=1075417 RepID=A0A1G9DB02_9BACT|nr:hypothetical protein [Catalinimonas alkaloidigena]SDK61050.1 hypothetical protein SAMN05421823_10359 [Catalinimonas alkaloidigena]
METSPVPEEQPSPPSPPHRAWQWNVDKVISITALCVSLGTFIIFSYQTRLLHDQTQFLRDQTKLQNQQTQLLQNQQQAYLKQQYASVMPYLEVWNSQAHDYFKFILTNNGVGPAFIREVRMHYRDTVYALDPANFLEKVLPDSLRINFVYSNLEPGRVVPAGEQIEMIYVSSPREVIKLKTFLQAQPQIEIRYASIYDEEWRMLGYNPPEKVE